MQLKDTQDAKDPADQLERAIEQEYHAIAPQAWVRWGAALFVTIWLFVWSIAASILHPTWLTILAPVLALVTIISIFADPRRLAKRRVLARQQGTVRK